MGGAFLQGGKKFAAQIALLLNLKFLMLFVFTQLYVNYLGFNTLTVVKIYINYSYLGCDLSYQ